MQDVGDDVTPFHVTVEPGERGTEAGATAASLGIRAAGVGVRLLTDAKELDAHVRTFGAIRTEPVRITLIRLAAGFVGGEGIRVDTPESAAVDALERSDAVL